MPKLKSSKKRMRQEAVRRLRNVTVKSATRTAIKKVRLTTDAEELPVALNNAYSHLDKAVKHGVIHKRTAARQKSRLTKSTAE